MDECYFYEEIIKNLTEVAIIIVRQSDGHIEFANQKAEEFLDCNKEELSNFDISRIRRPLDDSEPYARYLKSLRRKDDKSEYALIRKKDGQEVLIEASFGAFTIGDTKYDIVTAKNATDKLQFAQNLHNASNEALKDAEANIQKLKLEALKLRSFQLALEASSIVSITDPHGIILDVNDRFVEVSQYSRDELIGHSHSIVRHPNVPKEVFVEMWKTIKSKKIWSGQVENRKKDGSSYFIDAYIIPILDANGEIEAYIAARHDITEIIEQKRELQRIAKTDILTGLGNRFKLYDILKGSNFAQLALIDINGFHEINDFYGADFGDELIKKFAANITWRLGAKYEVFHLHGDEFIILNLCIGKEKFIIDMKDLNEAMSLNPLEINFKTMPISTTLSMSFEKSDFLLSTVNMAHNFAKKHNELFVIYGAESSLEKEYEENIKWAKIIKDALHFDRITVYYQPIVDMRTNKINKYEALVRLIDEDGAVIPPFFFLERAKKSGQYSDITKIVISKTIAKSNETGFELSINLTIEDILNCGVRGY